jgi:hypothetical protein
MANDRTSPIPHLPRTALPSKDLDSNYGRLPYALVTGMRVCNVTAKPSSVSKDRGGGAVGLLKLDKSTHLRILAFLHEKEVGVEL